MTFLLLEMILADQLVDLPIHRPAIGQIPTLKAEVYSTVQMAFHSAPAFHFTLHLQISPPLRPFSVQEWQYDISPVKAHISRSTG